MRMGKTLMSCKLKKIIESAARDGSSGWVHTLDNEAIYKETDGWVNVVVHYKISQMAKIWTEQKPIGGVLYTESDS